MGGWVGGFMADSWRIHGGFMVMMILLYLFLQKQQIVGFMADSWRGRRERARGEHRFMKLMK